MSRGTTTNLSLGVWDDGDNPGAGSKTVISGNTGLNMNWLRVDETIGGEHNTNGTHKDDKINGNSIKQSATDGTTLTTNNATGAKVLKIADGGVGATQLADTSITNVKISNQTILPAKLDSSSAISGYPLTAGATTPSYAQLGTTGIADDAITAAKISHDNNRTKNIYTCIFDSTLTGYAKHNNIIFTASLGIPTSEAGSITRVSRCTSTGSIATQSAVYSTGGATHFAQGQRLSVHHDSTVPNITARINDSIALTLEATITNPTMVEVEVEFDD